VTDRTVLAWSGGKDAAYALSELQRTSDVDVLELLTTVSTESDRSTMHRVHRRLHEQQAAALEIPLNTVPLPSTPSNDEYERTMAREFERYQGRDVQQMAFADIALDDVRAYREDLLSGAAIEGFWPLWGRDTGTLVREFLDAGFRATVVAVDGDALDASYAGRELDDQFLEDLPPAVDPCGENGEFHTFVWDGPIFTSPVSVLVTETTTRTVGGTDFHYADLEHRRE
jgi:uncharacterized protein (TIGR00290 family)